MVKNDTNRQYRGPLGVMGNILGRKNGSTRPEDIPESTVITNDSDHHQSTRIHQQISSGCDPNNPSLSPGKARRQTSRAHDTLSRSSPTRLTPNSSVAPSKPSQLTSPLSPLSRDTLAAITPPHGLAGPTSFHFSPTTQDPRHYGGRYLSFLSSHDPSASSTTLATSSSTVGGHLSPPSVPGGSPLRTMGSGTSASGSISGERRLCVMDLDKVWKQIRENDQLEIERAREENCDVIKTTKNKYFTTPLIDPDEVMNHYVVPLLHTSPSPNHSTYNYHNSQRHRSLTRRSISPVKRYSNANNSIINGETDSNISLEESLRMERQRIHSRGVTQFSWGSIQYESSVLTTSSHTSISNRLNSDINEQPYFNNNECRGPSPEQIPLSRNCKDRPFPTLTPVNNMEERGIAHLRIIVPMRGNIYIQDGVSSDVANPLYLLYDKSMLEDHIRNQGKKQDRKRGNNHTTNDKLAIQNRSNGSAIGRDAGAIDPQLSPDGTMVAFVVAGEIYIMSCDTPQQAVEMEDAELASKASNSCYASNEPVRFPVRITFGARIDDEEMASNKDNFMEDNDVSSDEEQTCNDKEYGQVITHGLADFLAQEEMDRYRGFWWHPDSKGILFIQVDESCVPPYRITHQGHDGSTAEESSFEDHRYPFAGESNPKITLGYVPIDRESILCHDIPGWIESDCGANTGPASPERRGNTHCLDSAINIARQNWLKVRWFDPPLEASEYLARVNWLPDGSVCAQWQDRSQSSLILLKVEIDTGNTMILHKEKSDVWINLHHMFKILPRPIHPDECLQFDDLAANNEEIIQLPEGSFSFIFASERTGFCHLYLYTYIEGDESVTLLRPLSAGEWIVESIVGVDINNDVVYITGTYDSPLERHLYALPLTGRSTINEVTGKYPNTNSVHRSWKQVINTLSTATTISKFSALDEANQSILNSDFNLHYFIPPNPIRLTSECGMHSIIMDDSCRIVVDTSSDLTRSTTTKVYCLPRYGPLVEEENTEQSRLKLLFVTYDSTQELAMASLLHVPMLPQGHDGYPPPEILTFPTSDGSEVLHAALYRPNPSIHGPGPYPLICAVYGGPHVQRVNRSWGQCTDMRVQRLCSLGFAVVKCDNRGSARRGLAFEGAIKNRLGRLEVLDQVATVRYLAMRGIIDQSRVGIYGWSYGGYLAAMCLCRAPDVFHVGIAGAPVTSWDGYDTHYTERYMGSPSENARGYNESAVFEHIPNMRGNLLIIHGLIDENVHFRHTARLINRLIAAGKNYDLLIFPNERHSPRRLRDRVYMEKRMSDYFVHHLLGGQQSRVAVDGTGVRLQVSGRL